MQSNDNVLLQKSQLIRCIWRLCPLVPSQRDTLKSDRLLMIDRGDGCQCCPTYLGILQWECVLRKEVLSSRPVSICCWGCSWWEEGSPRVGHVRQQRGSRLGRGPKVTLSFDSQDRWRTQKRVSFMLPSIHQPKSKANTVTKRQRVFTPELVVPPPRLGASPPNTEWGWMPLSKTLCFASSVLSPALPAVTSHHGSFGSIQSSFKMKPEGMISLCPYSGHPNSKAGVTYTLQECSWYCCHLWLTPRHLLASGTERVKVSHSSMPVPALLSPHPPQD